MTCSKALRVAEVAVRSYQPADEAALHQLWQTCLDVDLCTIEILRQRVFLDPNFHADGLTLATNSGNVVGFCLSFARRVPVYDNFDRRRGWITAFGVHPNYRRRGIARALFQRVFAYLRAAGAEIATVSEYGFPAPGVDSAAYPAAAPFLEMLGFRHTAQFHSMMIDLTNYRPRPEIRGLRDELTGRGGFTRQGGSADILPVLDFAREHFDMGWYSTARECFTWICDGRTRDADVFVAWEGGKVVGYNQHRREHFGPFGIAAEYRGKGIGAMLLDDCLRAMRAKGYHCAWFMRTDERAAHLYKRAGFYTARTFTVFERRLD